MKQQSKSQIHTCTLEQVRCTSVKIIEAETTGKKDSVQQLWPVLECYPSIRDKSGKNKKIIMSVHSLWSEN
jgi:hypothetical protein